MGRDYSYPRFGEYGRVSLSSSIVSREPRIVDYGGKFIDVRFKSELAGVEKPDGSVGFPRRKT
jgi:hypothetical protein